MKYLSVLLIFFSVYVSAQNPYAALKCDSVIIFDYGTTYGEEGTNISKDDHYYRFVHMPVKAQTLTKTEADALIYRVDLKSSYGQIHAICFDPHLAAMFMKNGKAIAYIEFCVNCNWLGSSLELKASQQGGYDAGNGVVYYNASGLSKGFRAFLKGILVKYGFSHTPDGTSSFD